MIDETVTDEGRRSDSPTDQLKGGRLRWTAHDVMNLMTGVSQYGHAWSTIIKRYDFRGRNAKAISDKFYSIAGKGDRRTVYSKEEEERLIQGVKRFGCRSWRRISQIGEEEGHSAKRIRSEHSDCTSKTRQYEGEDSDDDDESEEGHHGESRLMKFPRFQSLLLAVAADQINRQSQKRHYGAFTAA
uniref:Myb-like domain-containing protein n=1 Tax=Spongospora subterranea TaxID=70186 RepID=A0A0H5QW70_9EUKA|eukprot:CRZ05866.1 hypothetical protein [Spongospora subterranea]